MLAPEHPEGLEPLVRMLAASGLAVMAEPAAVTFTRRDVTA